MAARKPVRRNDKDRNPKGSQVVVIFWLVFIVVIISVFMLNGDVIKKNFGLFKTRLTVPVSAEEELLDEDEEPQIAAREQPPAAERQTAPLAPPAAPERETRQQEPQRPAEPQKPADPQRSAEQPAQTAPQAAQPAQTRDRAIYFTRIDNDGQILQSRVTRRIPVSDSPMHDALNVLLSGPSSDEISRGILNMIPQNTRIIPSPTVRGSTAYINFSEDFLFNTFGVEGYVAQLRQIVWTVTEFSTVKDVQILVEGRRLDYLGEGIYIGSPINRQSF